MMNIRWQQRATNSVPEREVENGKGEVENAKVKVESGCLYVPDIG